MLVSCASSFALVSCLQGRSLLHHAFAERRVAVLHHRADRIGLGLHQAHPYRQREEGLHDHFASTGEPLDTLDVTRIVIV